MSISLGAPITTTTAYEIWSIAAALVLAGIGIVVAGRLLAIRSPLAFETGVPETGASAWSLLALAGAYLLVPVAAGVIYTLHRFSPVSSFLFLFGPLFGVLMLVIALSSSSRHRQLGWEAALLFLTVPFALLLANLYVPGGPVGSGHAIGVYINYSSSINLAVFCGVVVAVIACLPYLTRLARGHRFGSFTFVLLVGLLLVYYGVAYVFVLAYSALHAPTRLYMANYFFSFAGFNFDSAIVVGGDFIPAFVYAPVFMYALVQGARELRIRSMPLRRARGLISLPVAALVLLNVTSFASAVLVAIWPVNVTSPVHTVLSAGVAVISVLATLISLFALGRAVDHAVLMNDGLWLIAMLLTLLSILVLSLTLASGVGTLASAFSASASAAALIYGLWASPAQRRSVEWGRQRFAMARLSLAHVTAGVVVAVAVSVFVWEAFLAIATAPNGLALVDFPIHARLQPGLAVLLPLSAAPPQPFVSIVGASVTSLSSLSEPEEIISDSAGNLWFVAAGTGEIGRIAYPPLSVELFALHDPGSKPQGLTFGPGGNLWFTDIGTGKIGYLSPNTLPGPTTGLLREFPLPNRVSKPFDIVAGPDGNLWFTDVGTGAIGRMTLKGKVSEFPLAYPGSQPEEITVGPDGNLWFTEAENDATGHAVTGRPIWA